ncbi:hypothetical protein EK21DRAFT_74175 [Setomelanomma holmii]|uniref:Aminoglycoside phosphotransferase domain-containing protein n=1 Tax=Setomelanomma holmii TaxID=210430 RepID=A0A9P4H2I2_9PLEO|nr:hypothetical protein EK21DRAFT_74175 [Setomelanomma holmii]
MVWAPAQLPYLKPPDLLPASLPSESCFFESTAVFRNDTSYHRVVAVEPYFIVKYGRGVKEIKGQVLLFLEHHLEVCFSLPKIYAMYRIASTGHVCLIMQRMPGVSLDQLWPTLKDFEKSVICAKLNGIITSIRSIPAPPFYGSIDQGRFHHYLFYSAVVDKEICGPFDSEDQFNAALVERLRSAWAQMKKHSFKADFYEKNLRRALVGHKPVFSHSDLQRKNMLIHWDTMQGLTVSLVDWEEVGWFPAYWEYFTALQGVQWDDDWSQRIEEITEPWLSKAAVMKMVHQDLIF